MSKFIYNARFKNHKVSFKDKQLHFNEDGIAEVIDEHADLLIELDGYSLVEAEEHDAVSTDTNIESDEADASENTEISEGTELSNMTIKQLNRYAASENIDLGGATKKEDIISAIVTFNEAR